MKYKSQSKNTLELSPLGSVHSSPLQQYSEEKVVWLSKTACQGKKMGMQKLNILLKQLEVPH